MSRFELERRRVCALFLAASLMSAVGSLRPAAADTESGTAEQAQAPGARESERGTKTRSATQKKRPAHLDVVDATAFTITEQAKIGGETRATYESALRLLEQERYQEGIARLLEVAEEAPDVVAPYLNLGIAYKRIGDLERAEASLKTALELNPQHPVVLDELGLIYRETGRFGAARESYEKALAVHAGFHFAHRNLAILCDVYLNDLPCALAHYEAYGQAVPDDKEVAIWIADIRARAGRP
jgi:Flp pilus assembly protein TadD